MARPYDYIPRAGGPHRKSIAEAHSGLNVRAQFATPPRMQRFAKAEPSLVLSFNESAGSYRIRRGRGAAADAGGFREMSRYKTEAELAESLGETAENLNYVVLEDTSTGEVFVETEVNLRGDWTQDGRFDQITLFRDEEAATAYASERQRG